MVCFGQKEKEPCYGFFRHLARYTPGFHLFKKAYSKISLSEEIVTLRRSDFWICEERVFVCSKGFGLSPTPHRRETEKETQAHGGRSKSRFIIISSSTSSLQGEVALLSLNLSLPLCVCLSLRTGQ